MHLPHSKSPKTNTTSSIPPRYETVLADQPKEKKGFGQTAPRFQFAKSEEVPGST
jgi:hypothetical protein